MGPWVHETTGTNAPVGEMQYPDSFYDIITAGILWLDYYLTGVNNGIMSEPAVQYYLLGDPNKTNEVGCEWIQAEQWPPENTSETTLYLTAAGGLQIQDVPASGALSFDYDPADPIPTLGGNNLSISRGPYNNKELNERSDVLSFTSDVLTEPIRVEGTISATLYVSSNCPDTDFTVKLIDVYPDGREMLVTDAIQRLRFRDGVTENEVSLLTPGDMGTVTITLPPTAIVFNSGHSMKFCISSSNYPRYEINPNTANALYDFSTMQIATNTVNFGGDNASCVTMPIVTASTAVAHDIRPTQPAISIQNYPNPFNNATILAFEFDKPCEYRIHLYNNQGQLVRHLAHDFGVGGQYHVKWDGRDDSGIVVASGLYFVRISTSSGIQQTHKMLLIQ
jgi:putative CocE/NonD family hydrolase